jgi:hypothetical protein
LPHRGGKAAGMAIIGHWSIGLVALDFGASEGISHLRMDIARHKKRPRHQFLRLYLKPNNSREASHTSLKKYPLSLNVTAQQHSKERIKHR